MVIGDKIPAILRHQRKTQYLLQWARRNSRPPSPPTLSPAPTCFSLEIFTMLDVRVTLIEVPHTSYWVGPCEEERKEGGEKREEFD